MQANVSLIPNMLIHDLLAGVISVEEFVWSEFLFLDIDTDDHFDLNGKLNYEFSERCKTYLATGKMPPPKEPSQDAPLDNPSTPVSRSGGGSPRNIRTAPRFDAPLTPVKTPASSSMTPESKAHQMEPGDYKAFADYLRSLWTAKKIKGQVYEHQIRQLAGLANGNTETLTHALEIMLTQGDVRSPVGYLVTVLKSNSPEELEQQAQSIRDREASGIERMRGESMRGDSIVEGVYATVQEKIQRGDYDGE